MHIINIIPIKLCKLIEYKIKYSSFMLWLTKIMKNFIQRFTWKHSECTERYKNSIVTNYIRRACKISANWYDYNIEINKIKQMLMNNNYSNTRIDELIKDFLCNIKQNKKNILNHDTIPIYHKNTSIITIKKLIIYYKNQKL